MNSSATAGNLNLTVQEAGQADGGAPMYSSSPVYSDGQCGCSGGGIQAIGQEAKSEQDATALSAALQHGAKNENTPVRVGSYGGGGSVEQSNSVGSSATAANLNGLHEGAAQAGGGGIQAIGQEAKNEQGALAASLAAQEGASNANAPVRVDSKGYDGHVSQSNSVDSDAIAGNKNLTIQDAGQESWGGRSAAATAGSGSRRSVRRRRTSRVRPLCRRRCSTGRRTRTRPSVWAATAAVVRSSSRTASARRRRLRT